MIDPTLDLAAEYILNEENEGFSACIYENAKVLARAHMDHKQLPPRTMEQEIGMRMMQEFFDTASYDNSEWEVKDPEKMRLMKIGWDRHCQEESHGLDLETSEEDIEDKEFLSKLPSAIEDDDDGFIKQLESMEGPVSKREKEIEELNAQLRSARQRILDLERQLDQRSKVAAQRFNDDLDYIDSLDEGLDVW